MWTITCGSCGHETDADRFCRTPMFGQLPKNTYQCPKCKTAFERRMAPATVLESGFVMPGKISLEKVEARL